MNDQKQFWNEAHKNKILASHSTRQTSFAEEVNSVIPPNSNILELGCGEGNDSIYFAEHGHEVIATDFADVLIEQNQERYKNPKLQFVSQDTSKPFAFGDEQFDVVYARLSLHYFSDDKTRQVFAEIARVLKPGGRLCLMCKSTEDNLYGKGKELEADMYEFDGHVRHFFSEDYTKDVLSRNFSIDSLRSGQDDLYGRTSSFIQAIGLKN